MEAFRVREKAGFETFVVLSLVYDTVFLVANERTGKIDHMNSKSLEKYKYLGLASRNTNIMG